MAAGRTQQGAKASRAPADARVAAMLARHGGSLMRVARQWSLCHDDALDAFQRGLEIFVRRLDAVEPATEAAWLKVVIRHEAMAIRRSRSDCVADPDLDLDTALPSPQRSVEELVLSGDRVSRSAEALRALKPDEARALMLKAHGLSYDEIGRHCGWTYTKVNRAITEGRRRFMQVYEALETGTECERFAPILRALVAGRATSEQLMEVRPHLRRCVACRATVRDLHRSGLRALFPVPALAAALEWLRERFGHGGATFYGDPIPPPGGSRLQRLREHALAVLQRTNSSDLAASIHVAVTSGGGRVATAGAILGMCLSGAGAATVCVVTGLVAPPSFLHPAPRIAQRRPVAMRHRAANQKRPPERPTSGEAESPRATPQARLIFTRTHASSKRIHHPSSTRRAQPTSDSPSTASDQADIEFGFESGAPRHLQPTHASASGATPTQSSRQVTSTTTSHADPAEQEFGP